jgi:hypothetical protein
MAIPSNLGVSIVRRHRPTFVQSRKTVRQQASSMNLRNLDSTELI